MDPILNILQMRVEYIHFVILDLSSNTINWFKSRYWWF